MKCFMKIGLICIVIVFGSLPVHAASENAKVGGSLIFGIAKDITTLNPFVRMRSTDMYVRTLGYEGLMDVDPKGEIIPCLAESWTISKSNLEYTFRLRRGVQFHNEKELTAQDVKWSAEYAMQPKNGATGLDYLREVKSVDAPDRTTVKFTLKQPMAVFLSYLATLRPFPIVPKDSVPAASEKLDSMPPGTGPFVFQGWKSGREIVFVRSKNYWRKGVPYLDRVIMKPVEDNTVRFTSLRAGDLDMIERTPYTFVDKVIKGEFPDLKVTEAKYAGFRRIIFNVADPPFDNVKLRQAVAYTLDKNTYIQGAFWGFGESANQGIPKPSPWFVKGPDRERDPGKVKSLLKEAGVGQDFEVEILGRRGGEDEYQIIQQQLATAGIKAKITVLELDRKSVV